VTDPTAAAPATGAGTAAPSPWQSATVVGLRDETARARSFRLRPPRPIAHLPGQHVVVRLTAPDGYRAQRSYSVASAPDDSGEIELTVERLEDGEVSTFLHDVVEVGDELEVRGPIGGWFVWHGDAPALLVGGGSGIVPLMAMLRHARRTGASERVRLIVSVRSADDLYYRSELPGPETTVVHTRRSPAGTRRSAHRLDAEDLSPLVADLGADVGDGAGAAGATAATAYVCGSAGFADAASQLLVELGVPATRVRVERFGPSG
jgi:ferredoxin-NADP reductase